MGRWISDIYIRARMKQNPLLQGNCEYELWKQFVDQLVDAMPSIEITRCRDCKWNSECRMLDDDNGYCSQAGRKDENSSEKPNNSTISKMEQVEDDACFLELMGAVERGEISDAGANQAWYEYINHKDEPQTYVINPQEPTNDDKCFECDDFFTCGGQCNKVEDEPQTERSE